MKISFSILLLVGELSNFNNLPTNFSTCPVEKTRFDLDEEHGMLKISVAIEESRGRSS